MTKKLLKTIPIISLILITAAAFIALRLNIMLRVPLQFRSGTETVANITRAFVYAFAPYFFSIALTFYAFFIKEMKANRVLIIALMLFTAIMAIPQFTLWAVAIIGNDSWMFRFLFAYNFNMGKTMMISSFNLLVYGAILFKSFQAK